MNYTFKAILQLAAVSHGQDEDVIVIDDSMSGIKAFFTRNIDAHCLELDTGVACAVLMLRGMFGDQRIKEFPSALETELQRIRNARGEKLSNDAILVVSIQGKAELNIKPELHKEIDNLRVCWDAVDKDKIREKNSPIMDVIISSISLATDPDYVVTKLTDGVYFQDGNGKLLFSYTAKMGTPSLVVSKKMDEERIQLASKYASSAKRQSQLKSVFRLYVQSLDARQDRFRSFLSGWSSLEIFVNKVFDIYENKFVFSITDAHDSVSVKRFLSRIRSVMSGKYKMIDKFALISSFIGENQEEEIHLFGELKELRDKIFHGTDVDENQLPVEKIRNLLSVYLKGHINQMADD